MKLPKRISSLPTFNSCPGLWALQEEQQRHGDRRRSQAADAGSAAHKAVELLHRGHDMESLCAQVAQEFPHVDLKLVGMWVGQYARDPRNQNTVLVDSQEAEVKLDLGPVQLVGHVDQIREHPDGTKRVWDIKTGRSESPVTHYAWQLAGYALAATETFGEPILPGGVIRLRSYIRRDRCTYCQAAPGADCVTSSGKWTRDHSEREWTLLPPDTAPVFHEMQASLDQCRATLKSFLALYELREQGITVTTPGDHCRYCPADGPQYCVLEL